MSDRIRESQKFTDYQSCSADMICLRVDQLCSLTAIISGEGAESFDTYNEKIKQDILYLLNNLAEDLHWHWNHPDEHLNPEGDKAKSLYWDTKEMPQ